MVGYAGLREISTQILERETERDRERQREIEIDRQREADRQTDRQTERDRKTERDRETEREKYRERQRETETEKYRERQRETETETETERQRQIDTDRRRDRERDREIKEFIDYEGFILEVIIAVWLLKNQENIRFLCFTKTTCRLFKWCDGFFYIFFILYHELKIRIKRLQYYQYLL